MLLGAALPLCDTRAFLTDEPARRPAGPGFLHFFGRDGGPAVTAAARERAKWSPGAQIFTARSALRPQASPLGDIADARHRDPFHWILRQISVEAPVVARVDLGVLAHDEAVASLENKIQRITARWVGLPVAIPASGRREHVALQHAGVLLGPLYAQATTARSQRGELRPSWVTAGHPCFFVEWSNSAALDLDKEGVPALEPFRDGLLVGWGAAPSAGPRARILYIEHDGSGAARDAARALRYQVAALHAEREGLWIILRQIASGRLAPPGKPRRTEGDSGAVLDGALRASPQSDALQLYLNLSITRLTQMTKDVPALVGVARATPPLVAEVRKETSSFTDALDSELASQNVRGNVRRKAVAWARAETGEAEAEPESEAESSTNAGAGADAEEGSVTNAALRARAATPPESDVEPQPALETRRPAAASGIRELLTRSMLARVPREVLAPTELEVHTSLGAIGREAIAPGETATFVLDLRVAADAIDPGPAGVRGSATVAFEAGVSERRLTAVVTSPHFARPGADKWDHTFVVNRDSVVDGRWSFGARADGDRRGYTLSVTFFADTVPVGALTIELPRRGAGPVASSTGAVTLPRAVSASRLTVRITNEAKTTRLSWFAPAVGEWQDSYDLGYNVDDCLSDLGAPDHQRLDLFRDYCLPFRLSLPPELLDAIENDPNPDRGLTIMTSATLVPFELLPVDRGRTLLGMTRPVLRWPILLENGSRALGVTELYVRKVGCIRPSYTKKPLPSAAFEEQDLVEQFGPLALANDRTQLEQLLAQSDVDLLHFAGHAQHNPARLKLGDAEESLRPEAFYGKALTERAPSPFFFVNGCEAGLGRTGVLPTLGNMLETLLACKFVGAVAPLIMVDSQAARDAAKTFYAASVAGKSVGQAVQAIHALAEAQPDKAGTFLSYVAYAPPDLRLRFPPR